MTWFSKKVKFLEPKRKFRVDFLIKFKSSSRVTTIHNGECMVTTRSYEEAKEKVLKEVREAVYIEIP